MIYGVKGSVWQKNKMGFLSSNVSYHKLHMNSKTKISYFKYIHNFQKTDPKLIELQMLVKFPFQSETTTTLATPKNFVL